MAKKIQIVQLESGNYTARKKSWFGWKYLTIEHMDCTFINAFYSPEDAEKAAVREWGAHINESERIVVKEIDIG